MPTKFFDVRTLRLAEPEIIDPSQEVILQIMGKYYLVSSEIRKKGRRGILPDGRFIIVVWNKFFPYGQYDIGISYEVATPEKISSHNPLIVREYDPQKLRINGYGHIFMTIKPVGIGCFENYEDVEHLMRELMFFRLNHKHQVNFEYEDFSNHALAPFLHLKRESLQSERYSMGVKVIQVTITQSFKPAISSTDPNGEFTWGKLLDVFGQTQLTSCPNDFLPKNLVVSMPLELELGGHQEPFQIIQLLSTKAVYRDALDDKVVMGFMMTYNPPKSDHDLPAIRLESYQRKLTDLVFPADQKTGTLSLWLAMK